MLISSGTTSTLLPRDPRGRYSSLCAALLLGVFLNLALVSCASLPGHWRQPDEQLPPYREIQAVPFFPQKAFQCGPSSLAMMLAWSGTPVDPDTLSTEVFTPSQKGSLQPAMISAARRHGRIAYPISGVPDLLKEVAAGHPAIVLQNRGLSWFPLWHYAVVIGYDLDAGYIVLHSGETKRKLLRLRVFENTWARSDYWAMLVLAPNDLPVTAKEDEFVAAAVGLEKAGQWAAAVEAYTAALGRWPTSLSILMGVGNSYYAMGDMNAAETVFRSATLQFPNEGSPYNNLAQVLWEQGRREEALVSAQKAVAAGGPLKPIYRQTLQQIQNQ